MGLLSGLLNPFGGGGSESFSSGGIGNSSTTDRTSNADLRITAGEGSTNTTLKIDGTNNTVTTTDYGSVDGALKLALAGIEGANATAQQTIAAQGSLLNGALSMAGQQQQAFTDTVSNIKTSDVRVLVIAGLAVVGLGAVVLFKKA